MTYGLTITTADRSAILRIAGDLDYQTTDDLVAVATQLVDQNNLRHLHLDFGETAFVDSAALSGLLMLQRKTTKADVELHLDNRPPFLDRVLQITGLFGHFNLTGADSSRDKSNLVGQTGSGESGVR